MKHLETAKATFENRMIVDKKFTDFITIEGNELRVKIQDGTINEVGVNGIQVSDLLEYIGEIFYSLDTAFPSIENANTIANINLALGWQALRTRDRERRKVEGFNEL